MVGTVLTLTSRKLPCRISPGPFAWDFSPVNMKQCPRRGQYSAVSQEDSPPCQPPATRWLVHQLENTAVATCLVRNPFTMMRVSPQQFLSKCSGRTSVPSAASSAHLSGSFSSKDGAGRVDGTWWYARPHARYARYASLLAPARRGEPSRTISLCRNKLSRQKLVSIWIELTRLWLSSMNPNFPGGASELSRA